MTQREATTYALEALQQKGAQLVSITSSAGYTEELNADIGEFSLYRTLFNSSVSLKVIKDGKKGSGVTNSFDKTALDEAIAAALAAAEAGVVDEDEGIAEKTENKTFTSGVLSADKELLFQRILEYMNELKKNYPKVNLEQFIAQYVNNNVLLMNSNGVELSSHSGFYDYSSMFSGHDGPLSTSFNGYGGTFTDLSTPLIDFGMMRTVFEDTVKSFHATPVRGKFTGPVIFTPTCVGEFLYNVMRLFAGEAPLIQKTALWRDQLGQQVASSKLTFGSYPHDPRIICGAPFTNDGYLAADMDFIKEGVLKSFLLSRYGSKKTGLPRSANLSGDLIVAPGDANLAEMIAGIEHGLIVNRFSGGAPAGNGDFSGVAKNSFIIQDGKIVGPLNETMISGNLAEIVQNIIAISQETVCDGGSVLPWIAAGGITISGA
ncbi:MAG: TldD/PmbA family protein [Symbiobacteriaceae bacterium]|nr:TldD/PmbA family protein [Symbiobacteriaceae bacterium]